MFLGLIFEGFLIKFGRVFDLFDESFEMFRRDRREIVVVLIGRRCDMIVCRGGL